MTCADEDEPFDVFRYHVIRLWEQPVEPFLTGHLGLLPLAPLTDEATSDLPAVLGRMEKRLQTETDVANANKLRTAAYVLLGLNYSADQIKLLFRGITDMRESSTYQAIVAEGVAQGSIAEARKLVLALGTKRFGKPRKKEKATIEQMNDLAQIESLGKKILDVANWKELLDS